MGFAWSCEIPFDRSRISSDGKFTYTSKRLMETTNMISMHELTVAEIDSVSGGRWGNCADALVEGALGGMIGGAIGGFLVAGPVGAAVVGFNGAWSGGMLAMLSCKAIRVF